MPDAILLLLAVALLVLPGLALLSAAGVRAPSWFTLAPAVTVLAAVMLGALYAPLGLRWSAGSALAGLVVLVALVLGARALRRRGVGARAGGAAPAAGALGAGGAGGATVVAMLVLAGVSFLVVLSVVPGSMGGLGTLNNAYDAWYHTSALQHMRDTGDVSVFTGTAPMYYGTSSFYPTAFHTLAVLMPAPVVEAANATVLALLVVQPVLAAGLADAVLPGRRTSVPRALAVAAAGATVLVLRSVATMALVMALWPNTLGAVLLLPSATAAVLTARRWAGADRPGRLALLGLVAAVAGGAVLAHPSALLNLGVLVAAGLAVRAVVASAHGRPWPQRLVPLAVLLAGLGGFFAVSAGLLAGMDLTTIEGNPVDALVALLADRPRIPVVPLDALPVLPWLVLAALGALTAVRRRSRLGWTAGVIGCAAMVLTLATRASGTAFGHLSNAWYGAPERIAPLWTVALVVLVALGLDGVRRGLHRWRANGRLPARIPLIAAAGLPLVLLVSAAAVALLPARLPLLASLLYTDGHDYFAPYVSTTEHEFIASTAEQLPADAVVLGSPLDGTVAWWTVGAVEVVYPNLAPPGTLDTRRVGQYGDELGENPEVCASFQDLGVTHLYRDTGPYGGEIFTKPGREQMWAGLDGIEAEHLEVVARDGPYVLFSVQLPCD